jgi:hypothetical protein
MVNQRAEKVGVKMIEILQPSVTVYVLPESRLAKLKVSVSASAT